MNIHISVILLRARNTYLMCCLALCTQIFPAFFVSCLPASLFRFYFFSLLPNTKKAIQLKKEEQNSKCDIVIITPLPRKIYIIGVQLLAYFSRKCVHFPKEATKMATVDFFSFSSLFFCYNLRRKVLAWLWSNNKTVPLSFCCTLLGEEKRTNLEKRHTHKIYVLFVRVSQDKLFFNTERKYVVF